MCLNETQQDVAGAEVNICCDSRGGLIACGEESLYRDQKEESIDAGNRMHSVDASYSKYYERLRELNAPKVTAISPSNPVVGSGTGALVRRRLSTQRVMSPVIF